MTGLLSLTGVNSAFGPALLPKHSVIDQSIALRSRKSSIRAKFGLFRAWRKQRVYASRVRVNYCVNALARVWIRVASRLVIVIRVTTRVEIRPKVSGMRNS